MLPDLDPRVNDTPRHGGFEVDPGHLLCVEY